MTESTMLTLETAHLVQRTNNVVVAFLRGVEGVVLLEYQVVMIQRKG